MNGPSYINVFIFVLFSVLIFTSLRTFKFLIFRLIKDQSIRIWWKKYLNLFNLIVWSTFGLLSIEYFSFHNRLIAILLTIIMTIASAIIFYYYFKEYVIGIFYRLHSNLKQGDVVRNDTYNGKINQLSINQVLIEQEDGSVIGIAYSLLIFNPLIKQTPSPFLHRFEETFHASTDIDRNSFLQEIKKQLMKDMRVNNSIRPRIEISEAQEEDILNIQITAFLFRNTDSQSVSDGIHHLIKENTAS